MFQFEEALIGWQLNQTRIKHFNSARKYPLRYDFTPGFFSLDTKVFQALNDVPDDQHFTHLHFRNDNSFLLSRKFISVLSILPVFSGYQFKASPVTGVQPELIESGAGRTRVKGTSINQTVRGTQVQVWGCAYGMQQQLLDCHPILQYTLEKKSYAAVFSKSPFFVNPSSSFSNAFLKFDEPQNQPLNSTFCTSKSIMSIQSNQLSANQSLRAQLIGFGYPCSQVSAVLEKMSRRQRKLLRRVLQQQWQSVDQQLKMLADHGLFRIPFEYSRVSAEVTIKFISLLLQNMSTFSNAQLGLLVDSLADLFSNQLNNFHLYLQVVGFIPYDLRYKMLQKAFCNFKQQEHLQLLISSLQPNSDNLSGLLSRINEFIKIYSRPSIFQFRQLKQFISKHSRFLESTNQIKSDFEITFSDSHADTKNTTQLFKENHSLTRQSQSHQSRCYQVTLDKKVWKVFQFHKAGRMLLLIELLKNNGCSALFTSVLLRVSTREGRFTVFNSFISMQIVKLYAGPSSAYQIQILQFGAHAAALHYIAHQHLRYIKVQNMRLSSQNQAFLEELRTIPLFDLFTLLKPEVVRVREERLSLLIMNQLVQQPEFGQFVHNLVLVDELNQESILFATRLKKFNDNSEFKVSLRRKLEDRATLLSSKPVSSKIPSLRQTLHLIKIDPPKIQPARQRNQTQVRRHVVHFDASDKLCQKQAGKCIIF